MTQIANFLVGMVTVGSAVGEQNTINKAEITSIVKQNESESIVNESDVAEALVNEVFQSLADLQERILEFVHSKYGADTERGLRDLLENENLTPEAKEKILSYIEESVMQQENENGSSNFFPFAKVLFPDYAEDIDAIEAEVNNPEEVDPVDLTAKMIGDLAMLYGSKDKADNVFTKAIDLLQKAQAKAKADNPDSKKAEVKDVTDNGDDADK